MSYELDKSKKPTQIRYYIKCKVVAKSVTYLDEQSNGVAQVTDTLVALIPDESSQKAKFFITWLPDTDLEAQELGCEIANPIYTVFRAALWRRTQHFKDYHLLVMTKSTEELLKPYHGKFINVEILGEDEEQTLDEQRDYDLPYQKKFDVVDSDTEEDGEEYGESASLG